MPVFTLSVEDEEHAYVAEGFISANSTGAAAVNLATIELVEGPLPFFKWGPNSGLVTQTHDALLFEVPESKAEWAKQQVNEAMNQSFPCLQVPLTASAKIITSWDQG